MPRRTKVEVRIRMHASAVVIREAGLLIQGPSGSGKSSLALALIAMAETAGWFARLVGDDQISLESRNGRLIARGHPLILGQIERRGQGILRVPFLPAAVVRLVIDLESSDGVTRFPEHGEERIELAGVSLPFLRLHREDAASDLALAVLQLFHARWESA